MLAKVRSGERAFFFSAGRGWELGVSLTRAAARTTVTCRLTAARALTLRKSDKVTFSIFFTPLCALRRALRERYFSPRTRPRAASLAALRQFTFGRGEK